MSYVLGLIAADGNITLGHSFDIALHKNDVELLNDIKKEIKYTGNLRKSKSDNSMRLVVNSKEMVEDLQKLGFTNNKSFTIDLPKDIPDKYIIDFIRGYFDGDGSIGLQHLKSKSPQLRSRICSGSITILEKFIDFLHEKYDLRKVNIIGVSSIYEFCYSKKDSLKFYKAMYHSDNILYMKRKRKVYDDFIKSRI